MMGAVADKDLQAAKLPKANEPFSYRGSVFIYTEGAEKNQESSAFRVQRLLILRETCHSSVPRTFSMLSGFLVPIY